MTIKGGVTSLTNEYMPRLLQRYRALAFSHLNCRRLRSNLALSFEYKVDVVDIRAGSLPRGDYFENTEEFV